jgi:hypothetical protein
MRLIGPLHCGHRRADIARLLVTRRSVLGRLDGLQWVLHNPAAATRPKGPAIELVRSQFRRAGEAAEIGARTRDSGRRQSCEPSKSVRSNGQWDAGPGLPRFVVGRAAE